MNKQRRRHMAGDCVVMWIDANMDLRDEYYQKTLEELQSVANHVEICTTVAQCIESFQECNGALVFLIVSEKIGQELIPKIHSMAQLDSIYIFCDNTEFTETWVGDWNKIKGVHTSMKTIYETLTITIKQSNRNNVSLSIIGANEDGSNKNLNRLEPTFMYTQIFKEILLDLEYDRLALKNLATFCRELYLNNVVEINFINSFEEKYQSSEAIRWYTRECFIYKMLNGALRTLNGNIIIRMGFFLGDLHKQIEDLYKQQVSNYHDEVFLVFRGQGLSKDAFDKMSKNKGGLIAFNNFLSTSTNRDVSLRYAIQGSRKKDGIGILYQMSIDPSISSSPFASVREVSDFSEEDEIIFSMHTIFRISDIEKIDNKHSLYQVNLNLTSDDDQQLHRLTDRIRKEASGPTGWSRLGKLLVKIGQYDQAEEIYVSLVEQATEEVDKINYYQPLGLLKSYQGKYKEAILLYEKSLEIRLNNLSEDDLSLANIYDNIGSAYKGIRDYSKALTFYTKALVIKKKNLPTKHPSLAATCNNIGHMYNKIGRPAKAVDLYDTARRILEKTLPSNHPDLAASYNNLGTVYRQMKNYPKALEYIEKSLHISEAILPPNHPTLVASYNNIGKMYKSMTNYSKALLEKSLGILQISLPPTHIRIKKLKNTIELLRTKL